MALQVREPGYVLVTLPNFGPGLFGVLTMDDVAREAFYAPGFCKPPDRPSFTNDIWPVFDRLTGNQWVNRGIFTLHGRGSPLDARDPTVVHRPADDSAAVCSFDIFLLLLGAALSPRPAPMVMRSRLVLQRILLRATQGL
jgi:hypothetical protein